MPTSTVRNTLKNNSLILSYKNLINNGDFYNGIIGWSTGQSTISASSGTLTCTANGAGISGYFYTNVSDTNNTGRKYYIRLKFRVTNNVCTTIRAHIGGTLGIIQSSPTINQWYTSSSIITGVSSSPYLTVYHYYADASTANGKIMEIQEVMCIDLTSRYGSGNEPSISECNNVFKHVTVKRNNLVVNINSGT